MHVTTRYLTPAENTDLQRRLRRYAEVYPDSDFLDHACQYVDSGNMLTRENAAKIDDALRHWEERLRSPSYDPDRCPPGYDPLVWKLTSLYRTQVEAQGWRCPGLRLIYAEIARVIERDGLRENYQPWRDRLGEPGWYRMMTDVITRFVLDDVEETGSWYAHQALAQPGAVTGIIGYLIDQAKNAMLDAHARPANMQLPTQERRAAVKAYIAAVKGEHP